MHTHGTANAFARAAAVLTDQLDDLVELFRVSNPTFYLQ